MINVVNKEDCTGCYACVNICRSNAISMRTDEEGFWYPLVDAECCISCGQCDLVCPVKKTTGKAEPSIPLAYAAKSLDKNYQANSSSGGVFSELARNILNQAGAVYGASFTNNFRRVFHKEVLSIEDLQSLRGSKYLQSSVGDAYCKVEDRLRTGQKVLFTGTPCQIAGLHTFLKKEYPNLYTQDIICHGVPSPLSWKKYVEFREERSRAVSTGVCFRRKSPSWEEYSIEIQFSNSKTYKKLFSFDEYMQCFLRNKNLRPSCYSCEYKLPNYHSDLTLGDFWGIRKSYPQLFDSNGISLVLVHTQKGEDLLKQCLNNISLVEVDCCQAISANTSAIEPAKWEESRASFMEDMNRLLPASLFKKHGTVSFYAAVRRLRKLKNILRNRL